MAFRRILMRMAPGILTVAGASAVIFPNSFFLENLKEATQGYRNGFPVAVSTEAHNLLADVKSDLLSAPSLRGDPHLADKLAGMKPYTVFGFDVYRLGWMRLHEYGTRIGIPEYFKYKDEITLTNSILVNNQPVKWGEPGGQQLKQSLVVSEQAKKFAIARETLLLLQNEPDYSVANNIGNITISLVMLVSLNRRMNLQAKPQLARGIVYSMVLLFGGCLWITFKDMITLHLERTADAEAAILGPAYVRGGLEYYQSIIKRNLAIRALMGEGGHSIYTSLGDDQTLIRITHLPFTERITFFKKVLAELEKENVELS